MLQGKNKHDIHKNVQRFFTHLQQLVCAAKSVPPVTFAQAFQFPDWSGFTLKAEPRRKPSSFSSPSSSASSIPRPSPFFMDNKLSAPALPARAEARGMFTPYSVSPSPSDRSLTSSAAHPPQTQWTHFSVSGSKNSYAPVHPALPTKTHSASIFSSPFGANTLPPFVPTSQPMKRFQKKHARVGKRIIDPSMKKIIHPSSKIVKKMKMNEPAGQSKSMDSKSSFTNFPARINPEQMEEMKLGSEKKVLAPITSPSESSHSKTLMKQKRFQKLMKILKKIKHVRRPVKAMKKPMKNSKVQDKFKGKSKNYRIVNEDGSIKWGYRTPSGLFQVKNIQEH